MSVKVLEHPSHVNQKSIHRSMVIVSLMELIESESEMLSVKLSHLCLLHRCNQTAHVSACPSVSL